MHDAGRHEPATREPGAFCRFLRRFFGGEIAGLTVLLLLVGLAFALVSPNVGCPWPSSGHVHAAEAQMRHFEIAIERHREVLGRLPERLEELTAPPPGEAYALLRSVPLDPWGNAYRYERLGGGAFRLRSLGEDGERDTDDDLVWPHETADGAADAGAR